MIELQELETRALSIPEQAQAIRICDQETYDEAAGMLLNVAALKREIVEHHAPIKESAFRAHKTACEAERRLLDPLVKAEGILKGGIRGWEIENARLRREEERIAREAAARAEEELRLQMAVQAEELAAPAEVVQEILERPLPVPEPVVARTFERAKGVTPKKVWKWAVCDAEAVPRKFLVLDEVKINGCVRAMGGATDIPGIRVFEDIGISARSR